jgi:hypothetical protein
MLYDSTNHLFIELIIRHLQNISSPRILRKINDQPRYLSAIPL